MEKFVRATALVFAGLLASLVIFLALGQRTMGGIFENGFVYANGDKANFLPLIASQEKPQAGPVPFQFVEIDAGVAGDIKMVGDIDGDSFPDLVIGGMPDEKLNWYHYPGWQKTEIATANREFTTDGALGDVDGDNDLDIVVPDGNSGDNLVWFQNPLPNGDPALGNQWTRHPIGPVGDWAKDVELADFDENGRLDVATRNQGQAMIFFQTGANNWSQTSFNGLSTGVEGMASGKVDGDAHVDLVLQGVWVRNPGSDLARTAGNWSQYNIGSAPNEFKALVVDLDKDGQSDVLYSSSEGTADVNWWTPATADPKGSWVKNTILPSLQRAHTLQAADMDLDGDIDVVLAQMHTSANQEILIMQNTNSQATSWQKQVVATGGLHNGVVADVGNDGDYDIFGANWTGNPPVKLFENQLDKGSSLDDWTYKQVTSQHERSFGLDFADIDGDSLTDIVSGRYWYKNPGGDMLGNWAQSQFPSDMHAFRTMNVDDDASADVIAQVSDPSSDIQLYWLEATNGDGTAWNSVNIGSVDQASHLLLGAQGYRVGQVEPGGKQELLISSGNGIYYFRVPANPEAGNWPRVHLNANPSDEGFALGDIDNDHDLDVAATTGRSKQVEWYRNPGDGSAGWTAFYVGDFSEALFPDRTEVADLNGDGRLDIIVSEENDGSGNDAETFWWEQPADPTAANWNRHLLVTQATTNSLDTADMDRDGDADIILAEHRGGLKLAIWANDGMGNLTEHVVDAGQESHLGAQVVDLDGDNDLDIVSIAYDAPQMVHLWRNGPAASSPSALSPAETVVPQQAEEPTDQTQDVDPAGETPLAPILEPNRVENGQIVLYRFDEGSGVLIHDVSNVGKALNLAIEDKNEVSWIEGGGLTIRGPTILSSKEAATKVFAAVQDTGEFTIEAWLEPQSAEQDGPARIVTASLDPFNRNFTLGQEFSTYDVRLRTSETTENGIPSLKTSSDVVNTDLDHVVYTRDASGNAAIFVNGVERSAWQISGNLSGWDEHYRLALANEFTGDRPWLGTYHLVAIFNRALSPTEVQQNYAFGPHIIEPSLIPDAPATSDVPQAAVGSASRDAGDNSQTVTAGSLETAVEGPTPDNADTNSDGGAPAESAPSPGSTGLPSPIITGGGMLLLAFLIVGFFIIRSRH
jgi:hypothetical protein